MASHRNDKGMSDSVALGVDGKLPWTAGWHGPQTSADACGDGSGLSEAEQGIATEIERLLSERGPLELNALLQLSPVTKAYLRDAPMRLAPLCQLFPERFVLEPTPSLQQLRLRRPWRLCRLRRLCQAERSRRQPGSDAGSAGWACEAYSRAC